MNRIRNAIAYFKRRRTERWLAEFAGVGLVSYAAWLVFAPLGAGVPGLYLIIVANHQEVTNARTR